MGVIGQTAHISCSVESQLSKPVIKLLSLTRLGEEKPSFVAELFGKPVTGDLRFRVDSAPSFQIHNFTFSDAGEYDYFIRTNLGSKYTKLTISVTGKSERS